MIKLNNDLLIPPIGFGTYGLNGEDGTRIIKAAIETGYRLIDTAYTFRNEAIVGQAIRDKIEEGFKRENLYVISKLGPQFHRPDKVERGCRLSLERLGLDYIDLYLLHTPVPIVYTSDTDDIPGELGSQVEFDERLKSVDTWRAMERIQGRGLVRSIGVSNFNAGQLRLILNNCEIPPAVNQVEYSLGFNNIKMRDLCADRGITLMGFCPLGRPGPGRRTFLDTNLVKKIAGRCKKTPAQVALRFLVCVQ